jgi:hypothetical protein
MEVAQSGNDGGIRAISAYALEESRELIEDIKEKGRDGCRSYWKKGKRHQFRRCEKRR